MARIQSHVRLCDCGCSLTVWTSGSTFCCDHSSSSQGFDGRQIASAPFLPWKTKILFLPKQYCQSVSTKLWWSLEWDNMLLNIVGWCILYTLIHQALVDFLSTSIPLNAHLWRSPLGSIKRANMMSIFIFWAGICNLIGRCLRTNMHWPKQNWQIANINPAQVFIQASIFQSARWTIVSPTVIYHTSGTNNN